MRQDWLVRGIGLPFIDTSEFPWRDLHILFSITKNTRSLSARLAQLKALNIDSSDNC
jgi:hypothetical protein